MKTNLIALFSGFEFSPVRMIVSTTRSPRIFPIKTNTSTFDQIIQKKMPLLREKVTPSDPDLFHMVTALETKRTIFEQAFVKVK